MAYAYQSHRETFQGDSLGDQRRPSDSGDDWFMPSRDGAGTILTDDSGSFCGATYNVQLLRDISFFPDDVVFRVDGIRFCDPVKVFPQRSWDSGDFHFDFRVINRGRDPGYGETRW